MIAYTWALLGVMSAITLAGVFLTKKLNLALFLVLPVFGRVLGWW